MAVNESQFQSELLQEFKKLKARATKVSDRFKSGPLDIQFTMNGFSCWLECKFETLPKMTKTMISVDMSTLQRQFMKKEQEAGGYAACGVCVKDKRSEYLFLTSDHGQESFCQGEWQFTKNHGEKWDVAAIAQWIKENGRGV